MQASKERKDSRIIPQIKKGSTINKLNPKKKKKNASSNGSWRSNYKLRTPVLSNIKMIIQPPGPPLNPEFKQTTMTSESKRWRGDDFSKHQHQENQELEVRRRQKGPSIKLPKPPIPTVPDESQLQQHHKTSNPLKSPDGASITPDPQVN